jgi:hypothetical protein
MDARNDSYMALATRRITQFLAAIRSGIVTDVPPEYQACESCREPNCNSERAAHCLDRLNGEAQERSRRFPATGVSGTRPLEGAESVPYDVPSSRLAPPASTLRVHSGGEYTVVGGEETVVFPSRRSKNG